MFKFFRVHKEYKELIPKCLKLIDESQYREIKDWEFKMIFEKLKLTVNNCIDANLPRDAGILLASAALLSSLHENGILVTDQSYEDNISFFNSKILTSPSNKERASYKEAIFALNNMLEISPD